MEFKKGETIKLEGGKAAKIVSKLGEGGQGIVYSVKIDGKDYALKWYTFRFKDKKEFRKNLPPELQEAIKNEEFEKAAEIRDELKELRKKENE